MSGLLTVAPPLPPTAWARGEHHRPFPLDQPGVRLHRRGRHGLHRGLASLGLLPGDEVLVPAYHHGSEVEALVRAGGIPRYYDGGPDLQPQEEELEELLSPRTIALHLVHYLGFPADAPRWGAWCRERGLWLVEDAAQAWLATLDGRPVGSWGDLAIFSLYKTVGVPDGGAAIGPALPPVGRTFGGWRHLLAKHAAWPAGRLPLTTGTVRPSRAYDPEADFALGGMEGASWATVHLLPRLATPDVKARRRGNYERLLSLLAPRVPAPFGVLPPGACPYAFPLEVTNPAGAAEALLRQGIRATIWWSVPHPTLVPTNHPGASRRRASTLLLPVHQELRPRDVERIGKACLELSPAPPLRDASEHPAPS